MDVLRPKQAKPFAVEVKVDQCAAGADPVMLLGDAMVGKSTHLSMINTARVLLQRITALETAIHVRSCCTNRAMRD
jgi:hypothetical protein